MLTDRIQQRIQSLALAVLVTGVALFVWSVPQHDFYVDEAFIGEYAYFHARDGYVHSEFWRGFLRQDEYVTLYHRLAVWSGSATINLFGAELWALRMVSICSAVVTATLLVWWTRRFSYRSSSNVSSNVSFNAFADAVPVLAAWLLMPTVFYHAKCFRPEMQTAMFGFASFCALYKNEEAARPALFVTLAGALAGAAMLTHLAGAMYLGAGILILLLRRQYGRSGLFVVSAIVVFSPCITDIAKHWDIFLVQISNPQAQSKLAWTPLTPLWNVLAEQERFFRKPQFIVVSCAWLVSIALAWRTASHEERLVRRYTALLIIVLGATLEDKRDYMALYAPFMALTIAGGIRTGGERWHTWRAGRRIAASLVLIGFVGYGLYFQVRDAVWSKEDVVGLNAAIGAHLPEGAWCLAPMNMMFNQIGRVHLVSYSAVADVWHGDRAITSVAAAVAACERLGLEYVVMNRFAEERERIADAAPRASDLEAAFTTVVRTNEYWILQYRHAHRAHHAHHAPSPLPQP
jgi:4-amino-4-deoxy-L-arabinose transferase-like glycosyltransferase